MSQRQRTPTHDPTSIGLDVEEAIENTLEKYVDMLRDAKGFFAASEGPATNSIVRSGARRRHSCPTVKPLPPSRQYDDPETGFKLIRANPSNLAIRGVIRSLFSVKT